MEYIIDIFFSIKSKLELLLLWSAFIATLCSVMTKLYIQYVNISSSMMYQLILNLTKQFFPFWNFLFNNNHDFY
jgi:hypothetical protein